MVKIFKSKNIDFASFGIYIVFIVICIILSFANENFLSATNLINILKQASVVFVIGVGTAMVLISGGLDLSSASVAALAGVCSAKLGLPGEAPVLVAFSVALLVGGLCGLVNGIIIAKFKVPAFIATLGTMIALRGMALVVTDAKPVFGLSDKYVFLGSGKLFGWLPVLVIVSVLVFLVGYVILEKMRFGRHIYAIGGNELSAHVSGINTLRVKIAVYTIAGTLSGFAGLLLAGRIKSGSPVMGQGLELDAIAAAVIGGVSTTGGIGSIYGAVIGVLLLTVVSNGLDLMNVSAYYQQIIQGLIIIFAVMLDVRGSKKKKK